MARKKVVRGKASRTNPLNVAAHLKALKALEKRAEGKTYDEIAAECGYNSRQAAHKAVHSALEFTAQEPAEQVRQMELVRLDKMWEVSYLNAQSGDNFAISSCLQIMNRRARYLGLDAPTRQEVTGKNGEPLQPAGVLVVPTVVTEEAWAKIAAQQQVELAERERVAAGNAAHP